MSSARLEQTKRVSNEASPNDTLAQLHTLIQPHILAH